MRKLNEYQPKKSKHIEKCREISFLMSKDGTQHAISLQLENLILTYGYEAVLDWIQALEPKHKRVG